MKFLDQAKIYIKAGNGGQAHPALEGKNILSLVVPMVEMEVVEAQ